MDCGTARHPFRSCRHDWAAAAELRGGSCNSSSGNSLFLFFGIRVETASAQIGNALVLQNYNDMTLDYFSLHTGWLGVVGAFCHGLPCTSDLHQHRSDSPELLSLLFFCFQRMRQATRSAGSSNLPSSSSPLWAWSTRRIKAYFSAAFGVQTPEIWAYHPCHLSQIFLDSVHGRRLSNMKGS